jgi:hypothetical protein
MLGFSELPVKTQYVTGPHEFRLVLCVSQLVKMVATSGLTRLVLDRAVQTVASSREKSMISGAASGHGSKVCGTPV